MAISPATVLATTSASDYSRRPLDNPQDRDIELCSPPAVPITDPDVDADDESYPEGGREAWLVVLGSFVLLVPSFGFMISIGTVQVYWQQHQLAGYTSSQIGWIPSVYVFLGLGLGVQVGPLFDRYGPRVIALVGSIGTVLMFFLLAECHLYWQFMLCCGVLGGITGAMVSMTALAAVSHWFRRKRGTASGVAMMGSSFGGITIPLMLRALFARYEWAWAIRIMAFVFAGFLVVGNVCIKSRLPRKKAKGLIDFRAFKDSRFTWLTISVFGFEIVLFSALGLIPTYASGVGFSTETGFYLVAVLNGGSTFGRIVPGYLSDRFGRFNTLFLMIVLTSILMLTIWLPLGTHLPALYAFTALFGFGTGSFMSLTPVCVGQICRTEEFGGRYGTCYAVASFATLICIPIGGELFESVGGKALVAFLSGFLVLSAFSFGMARWACLGYRWRWGVKV